MSSQNKQTGRFSWKLATAVFIFAAIAALGIVFWNPFIGCAAILFMLLTLYVGSVLKAYADYQTGDKNDIKEKLPAYIPLNSKELESGQRLLRYATAILAFLSLITTANGMQSFVFDKGWMAYIGSFAVQGILVVFSLLLCRFFVHIAHLKWPKHIRKLANGLLVIFFCVALIVSSTFSFSYIANNAYRENWLSDSEMIIQTHLVEVVHGLQRENERRGSIILDEISATADENLRTAIEAINTKNDEDLTEELDDYLESLPLADYVEDNIVIDWDIVRHSFPRYVEDINLLADSYDNRSYLPGYRNNVETYNNIISSMKNWDEDVSTLEISAQINLVATAVSNLNYLSKDIENWKSYSFDKDIAYYRTDYQLACKKLVTSFTTLQGYLEKILQLAEKIESNEDSTIDTELNAILSQIYLLSVDETISVADISGKITDLALQASKNEDFSSKDIASIMELRDLLDDYSDYETLRSDINAFIEGNLKSNYQVIRDDHENSSDIAGFTLGTSGTSVEVITETAWREARSNDFNLFYKMVKSLPDIDEHRQSKDDASVDYDETSVIHESSQIHRDLLGKLTDFEKAFGYFKYRFPFMAFFSAFIAVFFDLGSFLTGCFLYVTEYFKAKSTENHPPKEEPVTE